ncbi:ATP-grasp domain-containing protein [Candidatus Saccharibacteria bacterium]|nr:ATP-grasp domain-containing protein [Candidatus Saccharibacteria bacterium]
MLLKNVLTVADRLVRAKKERPLLSTYFPSGTQFFYGYPSGDSSGFLNLVPPEVEEMVAARVVSCAGKGVVPVCFYATTADAIGKGVCAEFGIPMENQNAIILPPHIDINLRGPERNQSIIRELQRRLDKGRFVMAQPYTDDSLGEFYQIEPSVTAYFNDKHHMTDYIAKSWLPERRFAYDSGREFAASTDSIAAPAVIKVSASSSGDGVCICKTQADVETARERFGSASGRVIVEEHIDFRKSYGVHFGIPADPKKSADLIGINEQITTVHGEFLGGIIEHIKVPVALEGAVEHLINHIVPQVRAKGWHGIGGFDVLVDENDRAYFIDANFRMTGMSAYHFLIDAGKIHRPMMSVLGTYNGSEADLRQAFGKHAAQKSPDRFLKIICMSRHEDTWRFNGALEYTSEEDLARKVKQLIDIGVKSSVLETVYEALTEA